MKWDSAGFKKQKDFFSAAIKRGALSHAYIFTGPSLIGKTNFAMELSDHISNSISGANQDRYVVAPEADSMTISIGDVKDAKRFLSRTSGGFKSVIISKAGLMTHEAQNALLKVLEEPSLSTVIILVTEDVDSLLSTIKSRCQVIDFFSHTDDNVRQSLSNTDLSDEQKNFIVSFAHGKIELVKTMIKHNTYSEIKSVSKDLMSLTSQPLHDRMAIAKDMALGADQKELQKKVLYWILYMHVRSKKDDSDYGVLADLLTLNRNLRGAQFNTQLALERFAIHSNPDL